MKELIEEITRLSEKIKEEKHYQEDTRHEEYL
jgi:hypothetical protein